PAATPKARARPASRPRIAGGLVWIVFVTALLAGIVALNVTALRLNLEVQRLNEKKQELTTGNAAAASELSSLAAAARVEAIARDELGLVRPTEMTYVRVRARNP
ncbi:MAG: cell division protein FtsL, partial [Actinomycetota bacterium]|nr:cell division protein FtsL [Actinomycetota bacterium]